MAPPETSYDPADLAEEVDLDPEKKHRILDLFSRLEDLSYYDILGVVGDADRKQVKAAYYKLAPEFHPDSYFRKNLGSFKARIEAIFTRLTLAHDVLSSKQRRAEYDAYLAQSQQNRTIAEALSDDASALRAIEDAIERSAREVAPAPLAPHDPVPSSRPALTADERRAILARKLAGGSFARIASRTREVAPSPPPPPVDPAEARRAAAESLRARYEAAKADAIRARVASFRRSADEAFAQQDYAKAANAYRVAAHLSPGDVSLQQRCDEVKKLAAAALADGYLKQARYEEHDGRWAEASLSYSRAVEGRPDDPLAHERAAFAMVKAGGSARRAVELARRAVELQPQSPDNRITLARAYLAASFAVSALAELDRAGAAGPMDAQHKQIVAELREQAHRMSKLG